MSEYQKEGVVKEKEVWESIPRKWREGQEIGEEYAFSATEGALNLAADINIKNFTFGTLVSATPCTSSPTYYQAMFYLVGPWYKIKLTFLYED